MVEEKKVKINIFSEDQYLQDYAVLMLVGENYEVKVYSNQTEALADLANDPPDLIISEFSSPHFNGLEVCKAIRKTPFFSHIPLLFVLDTTGPQQLHKAKLVYAGADDYFQKAALEEELLLRVKLSLYRAYRRQDLNPISLLPGQSSLIKELQRRIESKEQIALCCLDISQFKDFNRRYGFQKGDEVIRYTGSLILKVLRSSGGSRDFLAHPQNDDFFFITLAATAQEIAEKIIKEFTSTIGSFYDTEDRAQGFIVLKNRKGELEKIPLLRLYIGIATNECYAFVDPTQAIQIATELKDFAQKNFDKSMYVKERRKEWPFS